MEWVRSDAVIGASKLGDESAVTHVHPIMLCEAMWEKAASTGVPRVGCLVKGRVVGPVYERTTLVGAELEDGTVLPTDAIMFACYPWTATTTTLDRSMFGVKYHSAVLTTDPQTLNQSVFF